MSGSDSRTEVLKRAYVEVQALRAEVNEMRRAKTEPIAVIGMACRTPGGAHSPEELWSLLRDAKDAVTEVPPERWDIDDYYHPDPDVPGKMYTRCGGFLDHVEDFDAPFFGITPKEATTMDPQQRLLLEVAWEALENAGQAPDRLVGSRTGVYVGLCSSDYLQRLYTRQAVDLDAYMASGGAHSVGAGRISYILGLQGPCIALDTACSSSLVTVHLAVQSLRNKECNLALAGGANLILAPELNVVFSRLGMLAHDGRCKTFDASADGYIRSEGCGMVVLKRLGDAVDDGDSILAVIRGSAINQDGRSGGLTVPNGPAQESVIRDALASGKVVPDEVTYVEAHGTGTSLGDPIEIGALGAVYGENRSLPLIVGALKTNLGHLEAAAGVAGLIKTVLVLQHNEIPPNIHLRRPNPHIPWSDLPILTPSERMPWPKGRPRLAGVSSFGFSGTNAHVIVEAAPEKSVNKDVTRDRTVHLLALSAKTPDALQALSERYQRLLSAPEYPPFADVCFTANAGRSHFSHRLAVVAQSAPEAADRLGAFRVSESASTLRSGKVETGARLKIALLFPERLETGVGRELYATHPEFQRALDACNELLQSHCGASILPTIFSDEGGVDEPFTHAGVFSMEYALAQLWISWGIEPSGVMGCGLGEYAAACISGVLKLNDALVLIWERARLAQSLHHRSESIAIHANGLRVEELIKDYSPAASIAALNAPEHTVVSGKPDALRAIKERCRKLDIAVEPLAAWTAFHSPTIDPILASFEQICRRVTLDSPRLNLVSTATGELVKSPRLLDAVYWQTHARGPVRFIDGMTALREKGCTIFLELGTGSSLKAAAQCVRDPHCVWLSSFRPDRGDWEQMLESASTLYVSGVNLDWNQFDAPYPRSKVRLPNYPFERARYWFEASRPPREAWKEWLYETQWLAAERPVQASKVEGRWLILAEHDGTGQTLAAWMRSLDWNCDVMAPSEELEGILESGHWVGIIHLGGLDFGSDLESNHRKGTGSVLSLVQSLLRKKDPGKTPVWLVTRGAQAFAAAGSGLDPAQAMLWGLGKTLALEHPEIWGGLIDLDPAEAPARQGQHILNEISRSDDEDQVVYRNGRRYVARLAHIAPPRTYNRFAARTNATYLITGGLGRLGLKLARWLADAGARSIVLVGRTGLPDRSQWDDPKDAGVARQIEAVRSIEAQGVRIQAAAADVADRGQMQAVLRMLPEDAPLCGVIHAAAAMNGWELKQARIDDYSPMFRAKVLGTKVLSELTSDRPLDFFVTFSSTTSLLGAAHLAHYAAFNQFQDTFAHQRRACGLPALTINFGVWDETSAGLENEKLFRQFGMKSMDAAQALMAFEYLLSSPQTIQQTVASVDWETLIPLYEAKRRRPFLSLLQRTPSSVNGDSGVLAAMKLEIDTAPAQKRWPLLLSKLETEVGSVMGYGSDKRLDHKLGFFEMGMDSLASVQLKKRLEAGLGCSLPPTIAFNYPTIEKLAAYLARDFFSFEPPVEEPHVAPAAAAILGTNSLEEFSPDQLKASLLDELKAAGY